MSILFKALFVTAPVILAAASLQPVRSIDSPCLPADPVALEMLANYRWVDTTSDSGHIVWRQSIGLSSIPVAQIVLVSDTTICRRAVTAYNSILADDLLPPSVGVNVVKYGSTRYIIGDPAHKGGEWMRETVVDTSFVEIATAGR